MAANEVHDDGKKSPRNGQDIAEETKLSAVRDSCVIDIKDGVIEKQIGNSTENSEEEKVCRICHLGAKKESELIDLGCACKGELGSSHDHCAQTWFRQKGNRVCEICGKMAKNVRINNREDMTPVIVMDINEIRLGPSTLDYPLNRNHQCKKNFFNFLFGCLVLAFVMPWLLRWAHILP